MNIDADRLAGLARTKLEALVRGEYPTLASEAKSFNAGVGLVHESKAFVYLVEDNPSPMGAMLAWGRRNGATELNVVVDDVDSVLVFQAAGLDPSPTLWRVGQGTMAEVPLVVPDERLRLPAADMLQQVPVLEEAGLDVVAEHGVVMGEVLGLEVARVVIDVAGKTSIRVGVGLYDQEAHELLHSDAPIADRLSSVMDQVRHHRRRDALPHPLNRVARERWLRSLLVAQPGLLGFEEVTPLEPMAPRGGIHQQVPAAAAGIRSDGSNAVVACSTGIDLDLVPTAAAHLSRDGSTREFDEVVLVLPERDHHPIIQEMAEDLRVPATLTSVDDPWP